MRIFLSYASEWHRDAERLSLSLRQEGHDVFFDRSSLPQGEAYDQRIREALRRSDLLIFLISPESVESGAYALSELRIYSGFFPNPAGRVLPVPVKETAPESIPNYLGAVTYEKPVGNLVADVTSRVSELAKARKQAQRKRALLLGGVVVLVVAAALGAWKGLAPRRSKTLPRVAQEAKPVPLTALKAFSIFADPNQDSRIVNRTGVGTDFELVSGKTEGNWARVRLADGKEGWAMAQDLSVVTPIDVAKGFGFRGSFWQLFFTSPHGEGSPPNEYGIEVRFAQAVDRCKKSLDIAVYELDNRIVTQAILDAHRRGVDVRVVTDKRSLEFKGSTFHELEENGIPVVKNESSSHLMHTKFAILDGKTVWTGSWNYTNGGTYKNNENEIVLESDAIAAVFLAKFEQMFKDHQFTPPRKDTAAGSSRKGLPNGVEVYFGPEDDALAVLRSKLGKAQKSIRFMVFAFTLDELAEFLLEKARKGVEVQGILESRFASHSPVSKALASAGVQKLEVRWDGNPHNLHHNCLIFDDTTVLTGSFNLSRGSFTRNDENMVILADPALAAKYREEFQRLWKIAKKPDR